MVNKSCWSGWYWPTGYREEGNLDTPMAQGPMRKFDQYVIKNSGQNSGCQKWENENHFEPGCNWCGHCHGWSAASILEPEPKTPLQDNGIGFSVGDLKGMLSEYHCTSPVDMFIGTRGHETTDTLNAFDFHRIIVNWVVKGEPVVMDLNIKPEVWNYPVYDCQLTQTPPDGQGRVHITCKITGASDNVDKDFVGTQVISKTYTYWIMGNYDNPNAGDWEGDSASDHPGFLWHPDFGHPSNVAANPIVNYYTHLEDLISAFENSSQPISSNSNEYSNRNLEAASTSYTSYLDPEDPVRETDITPEAVREALISTTGYKRTSSPLIENVTENIATGTDIPIINNSIREKSTFPEWKTGIWWDIDVQQDMQMSAAPHQAKPLPIRMHFKIVGEEQYQGEECYHVIIVYPDRPKRAKFKYNEVWIRKDNRKLISGLIHIGDTIVSMGDDFLTEFLNNASIGVETEGLRNEMNDLRTRGSTVKIEAFLAASPEMTTHLTSKYTPFPIRIETPKYTSLLINWG